MGRTTVDELTLDLDAIISVKAEGLGKVSLWKSNKRKCKCAACQMQIAERRGYKFWKARFSDEQYPHGGYLCGECVSHFFEKIETWFWNQYFTMLYPSPFGQPPVFSGRDLATVWNDQGLSGLVFALKNAPRV